MKVIPVDARSAYHFFEPNDCDQVNPIKYFGEMRRAVKLFNKSLSIKSDPTYTALSIKSRLELDSILKARAHQEWKMEYEEIIKTPLQDVIIELLQSSKKKLQQKIVGKLTFDSSLLIAIPIYAWIKFGMPYSRYTIEYKPNDLEAKAFPEFLYKKKTGVFDYSGHTNLSEKQMNHAIADRHRVICDIVGDSNYWHCFFWTMSGIRGKEVPHVGEPHLHYISSAFGMSKDTVLQNLLSYRYAINAETIKFVPKRWEVEDEYPTQEDI